jgi:ferric-dicitrate binding protein FerR (iron transport regulator)
MPQAKKREPEDFGIDLTDPAVKDSLFWHLRSEAREVDPEERAEFDAWLHKSPDNIAAFLRVRAYVDRPRRRGRWYRFKQSIARCYQAVRRRIIAIWH